MSESIPQKDKSEHDQWLDVERLIEAVRGSRAARVLFEYRPRCALLKAAASDADSGSSAYCCPFRLEFGMHLVLGQATPQLYRGRNVAIFPTGHSSHEFRQFLSE
jgi:hypothetical protein